LDACGIVLLARTADALQLILPAISRKLAFFADPFGNLVELAEALP
jgi:hypothetical protein